MKKIFAKPLFLIFISAVLSALPYTFDYLFLLSWVSFAPLFYALLKNPPKKLRQMFGYGFLFGYVYYVCIYFWFTEFYPLDYAKLNTASSIAVVCLAWFGISLLHAVFWCIPTLLYGLAAKLIKNPFALSSVIIVGVIIAEKLTGVSELAFPWVRVSISQYRATALIQSASLFGVDGVDLIILSVNALLALALIYKASTRRFSALAAAGVFIINLGFGLIRLNTAPQNDGSINILTVQASVDKETKWGKNGTEVCFETYKKQTLESLTDDTELVIWPESAVPKEYKSEKALKPYKKLSQDIGVPILVGILKKEGGEQTNNAVLIDGENTAQVYTKRVLVPFGEYMPYEKLLSEIFPSLTKLNILEDDYTAGQGSALIELDGKKLGSVICFESIYPQLSRQSTLDGAQLLVEVTNDSWLGDSTAMKQHLAHSVLRSVENSRFYVRSANSGISAVIDSRGRILKELDSLKQGVITDTVCLESDQTVYTQTGDIAFPIFTVIVLFLCIIFGIKERRSLP